MPSKEIVNIRNLWVYYNDNPALEDITLSVSSGDFLGIIGPNGGGKSTLLKVILGLLKPDRGTVRILGEPPERNRYLIGYVPQYNLFDREFPINVHDTVLMGRCAKSRLCHHTRQDHTMADAALETVGMLKYRNTQTGKLSGGEQQRVFIARALVTEPKLLILDEPTASVDTTAQTELYKLMERLKEEIAIILVSHDIGVISIYVNQIACLNRKLYYHGTPELDNATLEATYHCPVQMITHGTVPHRVLKEHE